MEQIVRRIISYFLIIFENGIPKVELTKSDATFLMEQLNEIKEKKRNSNENLDL
ncbi:hypothetical protein ACFQ9T_08270 [Bacillus cereus]|uniref:hypothetical protein n=1 Tax=Bacillus cereus TaxID=1396 RepID=UPI000863D5FD|nr:hypothetical protein [Bacillus cereus]SCM92046.1 Protein of unknown function [Bacillus cereus]